MSSRARSPLGGRVPPPQGPLGARRADPERGGAASERPPGPGTLEEHAARRPEERIHAIAVLQHGVVTRAQLLEAGILRGAVEHRLRDGRLRPLHRGVYQVGPIRAPWAREMAAVLACGTEAALSHRSAAALWKLCRPAGRAAPEVTVPRDEHRQRRGIRTHRTVALAPDEVTRLDGIRLTTPARTLLDLAATESPKTLERALGEGLVQGLTTREALSGLLQRHPRAAGVSVLRALLDEDPQITRSDAEDRFRALMERARLPRPAVNASVEGRERDFVWRGQRLVVEVDGFRYHSGRTRFEGDRRRDGELVAAGFRVLRVTWEQLEEEPEAVVARVAQALAR